MSKTCDLRTFSWGKLSWTEIICVKKLTFCSSVYRYFRFMAKKWIVLWNYNIRTTDWMESRGSPKLLQTYMFGMWVAWTLLSRVFINTPIISLPIENHYIHVHKSPIASAHVLLQLLAKRSWPDWQHLWRLMVGCLAALHPSSNLTHNAPADNQQMSKKQNWNCIFVSCPFFQEIDIDR